MSDLFMLKHTDRSMGRWKRSRACFWLFVLGAAFVCTDCVSSNEEKNTFEERPITLFDYGLFDLGVTDVNHDDHLDVFTVNHSGRQSVLLNRGDGNFKEIFSSMKMDQDQSFPGMAVAAVEPPLNQPGVYVYWNGPDIAVRTVGLTQTQPVAGRINLLSPVDITEKKDVDVVVNTQALPSGATQSTIVFTGQRQGYFNFKPFIHALPIQFQVEADLLPSTVYVGLDRVSPDALDFSINMRDRHGMAWVDLNHDNRMDVFITRGGLRGTMAAIPLDFWDELLMSSQTGMQDVGKHARSIQRWLPGASSRVD